MTIWSVDMETTSPLRTASIDGADTKESLSRARLERISCMIPITRLTSAIPAKSIFFICPLNTIIKLARKILTRLKSVNIFVVKILRYDLDIVLS